MEKGDERGTYRRDRKKELVRRKKIKRERDIWRKGKKEERWRKREIRRKVREKKE